MVEAAGRIAAGFLVLCVLSGCGGGDDSGGGGGIGRERVLVNGMVDDGGPDSPVSQARCRARDLEGVQLAATTTNTRGQFQLIVPTGVEGVIACAPPDQDELELLAFLSTVGVADGGEVNDNLVDPGTTVISRLLLQELSDDPTLDGPERWAALREMLDSEAGADADLRLLADAAIALFKPVLGGGEADFEGLFFDLVSDSRLDQPDFADVAAEVNAAVAGLEAAARSSLREAYLASFPPFLLTLLHHSGAASALEGGRGSQEGFGGVARFATVLAEQRRALEGLRHPVLVSAGDQIAPSLELRTSLENPEAFFDVDAIGALGHDVLALGPRDLARGPDVLAEFLASFDPVVPMMATNLDSGTESAIADFFEAGRLERSRIVEIAGRRVGFVSALREDLDRVSSPRSLELRSPNQPFTPVQAEVSSLEQRGAAVVILLAQQADGAGDLTLARDLDGVDVMVSAGEHAVFANPGTRLVPGDEDQIAGPYPTLVEDFRGLDVPVVSTRGRYLYLGRLDLRFDALGGLERVEAQGSGPIRVAPANRADGVMPDADLEERILGPLRQGRDALASSEAALSNVALDVRPPNLGAGRDETNFGNLLADALLDVARLDASPFGAPLDIPAAVIDAGSLRGETIRPAGPITTGDLYAVTDSETILTVLSAVGPGELKALLEHAVSGADAGAPLLLSGMLVEWDPEGTPRQEGVSPGERVRRVELEDGRVLVEDGSVFPGAQAIALATGTSVASGRFGHPRVGQRAVGLGISMPDMLDRFLRDELAGRIRGSTYPEGGSGRLIRVEPEEDEPSNPP